MLITTYLRANGAGHIKDMSETIGILRGAHSQHKSFAELAIDHKADERKLDDTAHTQIQTQNEQVAGHEGKGDKFPELVEPHLVLTSPAGIEAVTPKSLHIATDEHTAITTGQDLSLSVGKRLAASVARGISLFAQSLGIKLFAAKGKVEIQAQSDNIDIIADKVMKLISAKESIEIAAKKEILLTAGTSYIKINAGGIEHGTLGNWKAWASSHAMVGPKSLPFRSPDMKPKSFIELNYHWPDDLEPVKFAPYEVKFTGGAIYKGKLDEKGYARIDNTPDEEWDVWFGEDGRGIPEA
jgi:type VI secretion system secreted protein VgrG